MDVRWMVAAAAGAGGAGALAGAMIIAGRYAPGLTLYWMFMDADMLMKLAEILCALVLLTVLVVLAVTGGRRRRSPEDPRGQARVLWVLAAAAVVMGVLGASYNYMIIQQVSRAVGGVRFEVTAPGYAQSLFCLACGLLTAFVALAGERLTAPRNKPAV